MQVQTLINPTVDRFCEAQKLVQPNILYFQGEQLENDEQIGSLVWGAGNVSDPEMLSSLLGPPLPTIVSSFGAQTKVVIDNFSWAFELSVCCVFQKLSQKTNVKLI